MVITRAHAPRVLFVAALGVFTLGLLTACGATTSGTEGAVAGSPASGKPVATECLVGNWNTTSQAYNSTPLGGAGQAYQFTAGQTATLDYTGSAPVANVNGSGSIQYSGTSLWRISKFVSTSPSAGTFTFTLTGGTVTAVNGGFTSTLPSSGSGQLAWTCNGGSATLTERVPTTSNVEIWTLKRTN